jgi:hypothetical protein
MTPTDPRCLACSRPLASPEYRALHLGPTCARRTSDRTAHQTTVRPGDVPDVIPGQVALPLSPMQPSLWSL